MMAYLFHDFKQAVKISYFVFMCNKANLHFVYVLTSLLLISGDIESNPGPLNSSEAIQSVVSILHLNIRSIRNKLKYLFETPSDNDILCSTESHLDERVTDTHLLSLTYTGVT